MDTEQARQLISQKLAEILPKVETRVSATGQSVATITVRNETIEIPITANVVQESKIGLR